MARTRSYVCPQTTRIPRIPHESASTPRSSTPGRQPRVNRMTATAPDCPRGQLRAFGNRMSLALRAWIGLVTSLHRGGFTIEIGIGVKDVGKRGGDLIGGELDRLRVGAGVAGQDTIAERGVDAVEVTGVDESTEEAARDGPVIGRGDERLQLRETPGRGIEVLGGAGIARDLNGGELRTMVGRKA